MMKRILILLSVLSVAFSCIGESSNTESGKIWASFEFDGVDYGKLFGEDSLYFDAKYKMGIAWDLLAFYHKVDESTAGFKGGFILSRLSSPESGITEGLHDNKYRSSVKFQKPDANTFVVFEQTDDMPEHDMGFALVSTDHVSGTCTMASCQVSNTVAVTDSIKANFGRGDKLLLKAKGFLGGKETGSAEMTLAEYSSVKDSILTGWTTFDLSKLGSVDKVDFELVAPDGMAIPKTVCIDNVIAHISLTY